MNTNVEKKIIYIKMFGKLELTYMDKTITSDDIRSEMAEILLSYILCHHTNEITMHTICEQLWEGDESDNPIGALKNLMYRLRSSLKKIWDEEFIITSRGSYRWNPDIEVCSDIERLDEILHHTTDANKVKLLEEGVSLYRDVFLPKYRKHRWMIQMASYYQSQFISIVEKLASTNLYLEEYYKLEVLCNRALKFDEYDVSIHYLLLQAYIKQNKKQVAIEHYKALTRLLMDELGISVSEKIKGLYTELLKSENHIEMDLGIIERDLQESLQPSGAFICEYGVFKEIYRLQARQISRMGMSVYCALLSAEVLLDIPTGSDLYKKLIKNTMISLEDVIRNTLRIGDTASRYSVSQYVILLPTCTYESSVLVIERLVNKFEEKNKQSKFQLLYEIRELSYDAEDEYVK